VFCTGIGRNFGGSRWVFNSGCRMLEACVIDDLILGELSQVIPA
jgi:hypothetical protein